MTQEQIHQLFKQGYKQAQWKQFLGETFTQARLLTTPETLTGLDPHVATQALKLGEILLDENGIKRQIAVYEVALAKGVVLERNRVGLRNLLRSFWKNIDAAFIVYHSPDDTLGARKWRFTYVSELTGYNADGEYIKVQTEPKRYTYVLGEGESTRTAAERFGLLAKKAERATLDDVKDTFSVEKLSKAFFDEYQKHYRLFCDYMMAQPGIRAATFNGDEKAIRDFTKKLLGRIVFLYFIQKKGWLGVPLGRKWGEGDFHFLADHFQRHPNKALFYQDFLCPLFFETLNKKRPDDLAPFLTNDAAPCRVPYLNGGLFEEDDPKQRALLFDPQRFGQLFDFFGQYNFTIYEDDPNDHTVAVDPEMLGHIFENLLEDNKDKGAFYTPKQIVHYMCQESLIEYLTTYFENKGYEVMGYLGFDKPKQPRLFSTNEGVKGQTVLETTLQSQAKQIDRSLIEKLLKKKLDEADKKRVKQHAAEFHRALDQVKICDPAIGSGAFPMGLLQEIFTAKQTLWYFERGSLLDFPASDVKRNIIQHSIYGVDIEKGAVDIARLRFWLSLVVDEETPKALPNLDYKIVVGNSLVSKLGDDIIDIDWNLNDTSHGLFGDDLAKRKSELLRKISTEQRAFFHPDSPKKQLAADIRTLKIDLLVNQLQLMVKTTHQETEPKAHNFPDRRKLVAATQAYLQTLGWKERIRALQKLKEQPEKPLNFFDWKLDFPEVLNELVNANPGFDIVIGNPPYVRRTSLNSSDKEIFESKFVSAQKQYDLYLLFIELGLKMLNNSGKLIFINPNKFFSSDYGKGLRNYLLNNHSLLKVVDLSSVKVFENALTYPCILLLDKRRMPNHNILYSELSSLDFSICKFVEFKQNDFLLDEQNCFLFQSNPLIKKVISKIEINTFQLEEFYDCARGLPNAKIQFNDNKGLKAIKSTFIKKYSIDEKRLFIKILDPNIKRKYDRIFNDELIILPRTVKTLQAAYKPKEEYLLDRIYYLTKKNRMKIEDKSILGLINSKLINFWFEYKYSSSKVQGSYFDLRGSQIVTLPVKMDFKSNSMKKLTDKILTQKSQGKDTTTLEQQIDNLVYRLYELSYDEVKVIDPAFPLSKEEYENIALE